MPPTTKPQVTRQIGIVYDDNAAMRKQNNKRKTL